MRMNSNIVDDRKLADTISARWLLNAIRPTDTRPLTETPVQRQHTKQSVGKQSPFSLENSQANQKRRSHQATLRDFIHSLFSGKKRVEHLLSDIKDKNMNASFPNLSNREISETDFWNGERFEREKTKCASKGQKYTSTNSMSVSQPSLQVPNIFITSLTKSYSDDNNRARLTTPDKKADICKCSPFISDNKQNAAKEKDEKCQQGSADSITIRFGLRMSSQKELYRNDTVAQITPYLFVGRAEAASDQRLLCKLNIHALVDITNSQTDDYHMNLVCPCTCNVHSHVHPKLYVNVEDTMAGSIKDHFPEINKFIDGSRELGRSTLIFSVLGRSRAPTVAVQYLVTCQGMAVKEACLLVKNRWPNTDINHGFLKCLFGLENTKQVERTVISKSTHETCNITMKPHRVKTAWAEYST